MNKHELTALAVGNDTCPKCLSAHPATMDCSLPTTQTNPTPDALVERLRAMACEIDEDWAADIQDGRDVPRPPNTPAEAADRITRLEAALRDLLLEIAKTERRNCKAAGKARTALGRGE